MAIKLKYFQKVSNAGDQFSRKLAEELFSTEIEACSALPLKEPNLLLLGSLITWSDSMTHVCGTGLISPNMKLNAAPKKVNCVRGPLTAEYLEKQGSRSTKNFGDPGILAPTIFLDHGVMDNDIGIIPHYVDSESAWIDYCRKMEILIIDPLSELNEYFRNLQRCKVIITSSLHGLIFAHSYGKPALWIEISDKVMGDGFKFYDYYQSIGVPNQKVNRVVVSADSNPLELAKLATVADHASILGTLESAIYETKKQLLEDA